jgi:DNA-binding transcriptional MerR regulator
MFKIGEFSKICQVSMRMLRYYDQVGLFQPAQVDPETGYRYYTADQLPRLNRILAFKDLGLTIEETARMIDTRIDVAEIREMLHLRQGVLQQQIQAEQERLRRVAYRLSQIENEGKQPDYDVVLKRIDPLTILGIREVAPDFDKMGQLLWEAHQAMLEHGLKHAVPGIAVFHDPGYEEDQVDWELGFPVEPDFGAHLPLRDGRALVRRHLPGVELMACTVYTGSYLGLHIGYSTLGAWIQTNGFTITGAGREVFLHIDPSEAQAHITEIQFPVQTRPERRQL